MKRAQDFEFIYPLKHKVVRNLKLTTEVVGHLRVTGVMTIHPQFPLTEVNDRYGCDIDHVLWNGTDIRPVLEITGGMDEIIEAAVRQFSEIEAVKEVA